MSLADQAYSFRINFLLLSSSLWSRLEGGLLSGLKLFNLLLAFLSNLVLLFSHWFLDRFVLQAFTYLSHLLDNRIDLNLRVPLACWFASLRFVFWIFFLNLDLFFVLIWDVFVGSINLSRRYDKLFRRFWRFCLWFGIILFFLLFWLFFGSFDYALLRKWLGVLWLFGAFVDF